MRANDAALMRKTDEAAVSNPHPHEMRLNKARKKELRESKKPIPGKKEKLMHRLGLLLHSDVGKKHIPATDNSEWVQTGKYPDKRGAEYLRDKEGARATKSSRPRRR